MTQSSWLVRTMALVLTVATVGGALALALA
jgi:hypothetical protein